MSFNLKELSCYLDAFKLRFKRTKKSVTNQSVSTELKDTFVNQIKPQLANIEAKREVLLTAFTKRNSLLNYKILPVVVITVLLGVTLGGDGSYFVSILLTFCIGTAWAYKPALDYIHYYKLGVMPIMVKLYGDFDYALNSSINKKSIKNLNIIPKFDYFRTEDCIYGKLQQIDFEFCELELERSSNNGRTTIFKGGLIILTMPFDFNAHTIVKRKHGNLANWFSKVPKSVEKIHLENNVFEQAFDVFSTDQILARTILTPLMMEQLLSLLDVFRLNAKASSLECEFNDNKVHLIIEYKNNLIEPAWIAQSAYDLSSLPLIEREIQLVTSIAEQLNLDSMAARKFQGKS